LAEKIRVSRSEYFRELGLLSAKIRRRRRLRSEYYRIMRSIRTEGLTRSDYFRLMRRIRTLLDERRRLQARLAVITYIRRPREWMELQGRILQIDREREQILQRMRYIRRERERRLTRMSDIREILQQLEADIERERMQIARKIIPPPPPKKILARIKIRIYNEERKPTPEGMFQGFFEIDALIDPETELPDWNWWLTRREVEIAKYHMIGYFKGMAKWRTPEQLSLAYFDSPEEIPYAPDKVEYKRKKLTGEPYAKNVPPDFIRRAERLTVGELIVGESSKAPRPNPDPKPENMGVYFEDAYIIDENGLIKWHERRDRWIYHPTEEDVEKVRRELKL